MKICCRCKVSKPICEFKKNRTAKDGLQKQCVDCHRSSCRKSYDKNKTAMRARIDAYRVLNSDSYKAGRKLYNAKNKVKFREYGRNYKKEQYHTDPEHKLKCLIQSQTNRALVEQGVSKKTKTLTLLGCEAAQLRDYLTSKFLPGMSMENHGGVWHIDHIVPCIRFDLKNSLHVKACFHYTNLQPLFVHDNLSKHAGADDEPWIWLIDQQIKRMQNASI